MFERFTDTARHVVAQAQEDARGLGHGYIGCEHLLLAAAAAGEPASAVLRDQGVTPDRVKAEILRAAGRGQPTAPVGGLDADAPLPAGPFRQLPASAGLVPGAHIPFTPRAKKTLALSLREAEALHDNYIGVQHLTLALLRPHDGTVPQILSALGAPSASLRAAILARYRKAS